MKMVDLYCKSCNTVENQAYVGKIENEPIYIYECTFCQSFNRGPSLELLVEKNEVR